MATGAVIARIISQYSDKGSKAAQKDIAKLGKQIDAWSGRIVKSYAVAAAAATAFAFKIGKDAVNAAIEDAKSATMLANSLRNVTGATNEQIAAVEEYITKQQTLTNVADSDLRSSLNALVTATGDVTLAQYLQTRALDAAAGSGKDLAAVTNAMAKASQGNFTALGKMFPQLDKATIKSGNFAKMLEELEKDYNGAAEAVAKQDPFTALRIQFGEVAEQLGYVLLPVVKDYANYLISTVIPKTQEWIKLNEDNLKNSFKVVLSTIASIVENLVRLTVFIEKYKEIVAILGAIPFANYIVMQGKILLGTFKVITGVLGKISFVPLIKAFQGLGAAVSLVSGAFRAGGFITALKGVLDLFMMLNPYVRGAVILATAVGAIAGAIKLVTGAREKDAKVAKVSSAQIAKDQQKAILAGYEQIAIATEKANKDKIAAQELAKNAAAQKKAAAEAARRAKLEANYNKINARIAASYGVKLLSAEEEKLVAINAAEALLKRQEKVNAYDAQRLKDLKEEVLLQKVRNELATRYADILVALADNEISTKDIATLAAKWGVSTEAAETYIETLFAIQDAVITDDEIIQLAMSWGSTQAQAAQYLDFYQALNDGILSDSEIEKLKSKWKLTEEQVRLYADFVGVVNDGKLTDAEIIKLQEKWKLSTDQVVEYIKKIGSPVSYSGTLIDPAKAAEIGWLSATAALQRYLDLLKAGTGAIITGKPPVTPDTSAADKAAADAAAAAAAAAADAAKVLAESEEALAAANKTAAEIARLTAMKAEVGSGSALGFKLKEQIDALKEADSLFTKISQVDERDKLIAKGIIPNVVQGNFDAGSFRMAEEKSMAEFRATVAERDYDERFRFQSSTLNTASGLTSGGNLMAGGPINVTVNVAGSVTAEQDLVQTVRNGLLSAQYNGNQITLQAI
jgi:hypothetical protein